MEITPLKDYVLLEEVKEENKSGILLLEGADVASTQVGLIVEVGEDSKMKKGTKVLFKQFGFEEITVEKKKYLVGRDEHVFAIVK